MENNIRDKGEQTTVLPLAIYAFPAQWLFSCSEIQRVKVNTQNFFLWVGEKRGVFFLLLGGKSLVLCAFDPLLNRNSEYCLFKQQNKEADSQLYLFQAFVHDPLINWRLFNFNEVPQMSVFSSTNVPPVVNAEESAPNRELAQPQRGTRERELLQVFQNLD